MKILFITILLIHFGLLSQAQNTIYFGYDAAGNRIIRSIVLANIPLRRAAPETIDSVPLKEKLEKYSIVIFPNPTRGVVQVQLDNHPTDSLWRYDLVNLSGATIDKGTQKEKQKRLELSTEPSGVYLLRTYIMGEVNTYKIIKE